MLSKVFGNQRVTTLSFLLVLIVYLVVQVVAGVLTNLGYILLSHALLGKEKIVSLADSTSVKKSQQYWEKSVELVSANPSAWRGLGWIGVVAGQYPNAVNAWQRGGFGAIDLIRLGEVARKNDDYEMALIWYQQAADTAPELGDPWYFMGLTYADMEEWRLALNAFDQAEEKTEHRIIGLSSVHYHIGWLAQRYLDPPDTPRAQHAYEMALALDDFSSRQEHIQAHFSLGQILHQTGQKAQALQEYEWVTARQPEHYWAQVSLGILYWQVKEDVERAEATLMVAISLQPENKWAYRSLAQVYQETGREIEAIKLYNQVLNLDPQDELALRQLDKLVHPGKN